MFVLPPIRDSRVNPCSIVTHTEGKVVNISELDFQLTCPGMHTRVANGFVADAVNFITNDRVHLSGIANYRKCDRHGVGDEAVIGRPPESFREVVGLRCRRAQGIQRRPSFLHGAREPDG